MNFDGTSSLVVNFVRLSDDGSKFFGFSEFLTALALMVLAWTIADVRYRFPLKCAPLPLQGVTFIVIGGVGCMTLLTDLWRAEGWPVPAGDLVRSAGWQAFLGGLFFITFMTWVWFAFIRPAVFGRWNARRFVEQLYLAVLRGSPTELPEIADELSRSVKNIIEYSWQRNELNAFEERHRTTRTVARKQRHTVRDHAYNVLLIVANRKFCRYIVQISPITALAFFEEASLQHKIDIPLGIFAKNITSEAIVNRDSFAYQEVAGYDTGYIGFKKPLTNALYGNYELVNSLENVFDVDYRETQRWDSDQWETFCRLVLVTFKSYVASGMGHHSFVLFRAVGMIQDSMHGLQKVNGGNSEWWAEACVQKLRVVVRFALEATRILDAPGRIVHTKLRLREKDRSRDVYDLIASLMFAIIFEASSVREPRIACWEIQHNEVWHELFGSYQPDGPAGKVIKHKLRRLTYNEVAKMAKWPNFKGSRILGMVLNVSRLECSRADHDKSVIALCKAVLAWTKSNYARVAMESPRVAADCLVEGMLYEKEGPCLVRIGMQILDHPPSRETLELEQP